MINIKSPLFNNKLIIPVCLSIIFSWIYFSHSLYKHLTFNTNAFDLGIFTQITYLYSQGQLPFSSLKHMILLADHFELILLFLSPIYKLFPSPITLLAIQAFFVSFSSIPIYLIAYDKTKNKLISFLISLSYLTFPGLLSALNFDFHLTTISVLPLSILLYAWNFKKIKLYWITLFISLLFKEDVPIFLLGLGIFEMISKEIKLGFLTFLSAVITYYLIQYQIMPFLGNGVSTSYAATSVLPLDSPIDLISIALTNPKIYLDQVFNNQSKINLLHLLYGQFTFLPILSSLSWLTVFPYLYIRFTSTLPHFWTNYFHHNANLAPFLAISTVLAIKQFGIPKKAVLIFLLFGLFTKGLSPISSFWGFIHTDFNISNNFTDISKILQTIPPQANVSAQSPLVPHLSNREGIYLFPEVYGADYIVLDASLDIYPMDPGGFQEKLKGLESSKYWKIEKKVGNLIIFSKAKKD